MSAYNSQQRKQYERLRRRCWHVLRPASRRSGSPDKIAIVEERLFDLGLPVYTPRFDGSPDDMVCRADGRFWTVQVKLGELNTKTQNLRCTRMNEVVSELLAVVWPPARLIKWVARNISTFPKIFLERFGPIQTPQPWPVLFDRDCGCATASWNHPSVKCSGII